MRQVESSRGRNGGNRARSLQNFSAIHTLMLLSAKY
jgi:hypothetical protein